MAEVSFKVSSAIKTIIGKELITDDFIAVFELVKNSFDANASKVEIIFEDLKLDTPKIIIKDNGVGMSEDDILNKWLFLAYSEKKSGDDYRDQIKTNRAIAGYKGIGRFSCDRLGENLRLITRKSDKELWNILSVDWNRFELDSQKEFQTIPAELIKDKYIEHFDVERGTILEITGLRNNDWDRTKLLKLRRSLERLINPQQIGDTEPFSIVLSVLEEKTGDEKANREKPDEPWEIVNGPIRNFLFEALDLKTTQIQLVIDQSGETLITRLNDRGTLIYQLVENNPYDGILRNITINLFFLNKSAKLAFTKRMGLRPVDYGSVFLYKNGFRVHPFGDKDDDSLGINRRKQQGVFRFLGSRDLTGRIEIIQGQETNTDLAFTESSSRDGGLIRNKAYETLKVLFFEYALRRLENYVVNLARFGIKGEIPELIDPSSTEQREFVFDLVVRLTQSNDVLDIKYDPNVLDVLKSQSAESVNALLKNLEKIAMQQDNPELYFEITRAERQAKFLQKAKEEAEAAEARERERAEQAETEKRKAEARAEIAEETAQKAEEEAKEIKREKLFIQKLLPTDLEHVLELHHAIGQDARNIEMYISGLLDIVRNPTKELKREVLQDRLDSISYLARKILTITKMATHANFRGDTDKITADLVSYIRDYIGEVYHGVEEDPNKQKINLHFDAPNDLVFETQFAPIDVSIVVDNLISNSRKHKTKNIFITATRPDIDTLIVYFRDDGNGIAPEKMPMIFEIGFTTTDGSGLGLYHSKKIMEEMAGNIILNEGVTQGAEFELTFRKQ